MARGEFEVEIVDRATNVSRTIIVEAANAEAAKNMVAQMGEIAGNVSLRRVITGEAPPTVPGTAAKRPDARVLAEVLERTRKIMTAATSVCVLMMLAGLGSCSLGMTTGVVGPLFIEIGMVAAFAGLAGIVGIRVAAWRQGL